MTTEAVDQNKQNGQTSSSYPRRRFLLGTAALAGATVTANALDRFSTISALVRTAEGLIIPKSAEAGSPYKIHIDPYLNFRPARPLSTLDKVRLAEVTAPIKAESITTDITFPDGTPTYALNGGSVHVVGHPEWKLTAGTDLYICYLGFSANRSSDITVLTDSSFNPSLDERMRALTLSVNQYDHKFIGTNVRFNKLDLGNGQSFLDMGSSDNYASPEALLFAAVAKIDNVSPFLKYQVGFSWKEVVFVYLTTNNDDITKFLDAGTVFDGYGAVLYAGYQISDSLALINGKVDPRAAVVLAHEHYHAKGLPHDPGTIMDANSLSTGNPWILTYDGQLSLLGINNKPDNVSIESLNKTTYAPVNLANSNN